MNRNRLTVLGALVVFVASLGFAGNASATEMRFWPKPNAQVNNFCPVLQGTLGGGLTTSHGNYALNRRWTSVYPNAGSWTYGALYTSGSYTGTTSTLSGGASGHWENGYYATLANNPFITNNNGASNVKACWWPY